jgi:hypothetical protein
MKTKKAQHEMVGFALIIIVVAILIIVVLSLTHNKKTDFEESPLASSFLQSLLYQTTNCSINYGSNFLSIRELTKACLADEDCEDGNSACALLNSTIDKILNESFQVGEKYPLKSLEFKITHSQNQFLYSSNLGNQTNSSSSRGSMQEFENGIKFYLDLYS